MILCVTGGYAAIHKLLRWHWGDRMYCLIFLQKMSAKFEFGVFLYAVVVCPSAWCSCSVLAVE